MKTLSLLLPVCVASLLYACSGQTPRDKTPVPRPEAWPRIAIYDSTYQTVDSLPVIFEANSSAKIEHTQPGWVNINYPAYAATIYLTVTQTNPAEIEKVVDNRLERMALNISENADARQEHFVSPEFESLMLVSPGTRSTPLQFVATDRRSTVISGTAFFHNAGQITSTDSVAPVIESLKRDLVHALNNLTKR